MPELNAKLSSLQIETAAVFAPLLEPARYKAAFGGRGSGKSHFFGELAVEDALRFPGDHGEGLALVCVREVQKSLKDSAKKLIEGKIRALGLRESDGFKVWKDRIELPKGGQIIFQGMQDHTAESVKSLEGFHRAWVEEAQTLSVTSLELLRPTIRAPGSELWFSWNPRRKADPVDALLRGETLPTGAVVVRANWNDNPWFPATLDQERQDCLRDQPEMYDHIWEGGYATVRSGAYYQRDVVKARLDGRIGAVTLDPLLPLYAFWDIGVSDATAIVVAQFVGSALKVLDYYEATGQPLSAHLNWLRQAGYGAAKCYLPHDADQRDKITAIRFEDHVRAAGFAVQTVPNQGKGAALKRIETARRLWPSIWIDEGKAGGLIDALAWYHERWDDNRNIGLGPNHDWASHGADAFGLMCVAHEPPRSGRRIKQREVPVIV